MWILFLLLLAIMPQYAQATTYYMSTTGSDSNPCTGNGGNNAQNLSFPKRNFHGPSGAIACMVGGDTLQVRAGTYSEHFNPGLSTGYIPNGTAGNPTIVEGYPSDSTRPILPRFTLGEGADYSFMIFRRLHVQAPVLAQSQGGYSAFYVGPDTHDITFTDIEIEGGHTGLQSGGHHETFSHLDIHGQFFYGTYFGGHHNVWEYNNFHDTLGFAIHLYSSGTADFVADNIFRFNTIRNCGNGGPHGLPEPPREGTWLFSHGDRNEAYNNLIFDSYEGIILDYGCDDCKVYNNTFYNNGVPSTQTPQARAAIKVTNNTTNALVVNNIVYNNGIQIVNEPGGGNTVNNNLCGSSGTGCTFVGNPSFENAGAGNFKLNANSAARNRLATDGGGMCLTPTDFGGTARPQTPSGGSATPCDVGAYEYQEGAQPFDFSVQYPGAQTVAQGGSTSFGATATLSTGTGIPVTFSVTGLPTGVSVTSITNSPCTPTCTATVTLQATGGAPPGDYGPTLSAAGGAITRTSPGWTLTVTSTGGSFDYSVSNPGARTLIQGQSIQVPVTITTLSGTAAAVTLSITSALPTGVSASWAGMPCTPAPNCTSTLTLTATGAAPVTPSPVNVTIHGAAGALTHDQVFPLTVAEQGASQVGPNPIYVRCAAASGETSNDSFSCLEAEDAAKAKRTLGNAITECMNTVPGKVLNLEGNGCTYAEELDTQLKPIMGGNGPSMTTATRIEGYGTTLPVIQSPNPGPALSGAMLYLHNNDHFLTFKRLIFDGNNRVFNLGVFLGGTHHIRLEEVELKNSLSGGFEGLYIENSNNIELVKVFIHHTGTHGISLDNGIDTFLCDECHVFNAAGTGKGINVTSAGTKTNLTFNRPEVRNNGGDGLDHGSATGTVVQNMINHSNGGMGFRIRTGSSGTRAYNNTIYGNSNTGLQCDAGASNTELRNNIVYANSSGNILNNCGATVAKNLCALSSADCAVSGNPLFVAAPGDLHLSDGSPGINAGESIASILTDYDGQPRRQGPQDIGAYERDAGTPPVPPGPGILRVSTSNPHYFENPAGDIVYLTGAYSWNFASTMPDAEVTAYLNYVVAHNHNYIRVPSQDYDGSAQSTTYFTVLASRINQAASLGIYVGVNIFPSLTTVAPFNNLAFDEAYTRSLVQAVGASPNVLYEVGNELETQALDGGTLGFFVNRIVDVINDEQAIRGFTPRRMVSISDFRATGATYGANPAVVTFMLGSHADFVQIGFSQSHTGVCTILPDYGGQKVSMPDSDHIKPYNCDYPWVWKMLMRGGNPTLLEGNAFFPDHSEPDNPSDTVGAAMTYEARIRMGDTRTYATKLHLNQAVPHPELTSTGFALAWPGQEYLVYQPSTGSFTVTLPAGEYAVEWFNPTAQAASTTTPLTVASAGAQTFSTPLNPTHDAVLFIKAGIPAPPGPAVTVRPFNLAQAAWYF